MSIRHAWARRTPLLALAFILMSVAPAVASEYVDWDDVSGLPGNGTSPHGGYATGTIKCAVCHNVHGGASSGALLLPDAAASACNYCHVGGAGGYTQVYDGDPANYSGTNLDNAHNSFEVLGVEQGVTCDRCHQVHAADEAMTSNAELTQRLLKGDKTYTDFPTPNYHPVAQEPLATDDYDTALTKWCAGCHFTLASGPVAGSYYAEGYNLESHVMTGAAAVYDNPEATYNGQVAWKDSLYCMSCHASEYGVTPGAWPHFTDGSRFLVSAASSTDATAATADSSEDGVCIRCHIQGAGPGVGVSY